MANSVMARAIKGCLTALALVLAAGAAMVGIAIACANVWLYTLTNKAYFAGIATLAVASAVAITVGVWSLMKGTKQ